MIRKLQLILSLLGIAFLSFACSSDGDQVSGIIAEAQFSTVACEGKSKIISIRNDDTSEPQRIRGVYFEQGTNDKNYFKVDKVKIGDTEYSASGSMVEEVIIPAGGILSIQTTYKPREITSGGPHVSYLDIFLNGPRLGIMQVRMVGQADTALPGCGQSQGTPKNFKVTKVTIKTKDKTNTETTTPITNITEPFKFTVDDQQKATITQDDFPTIKIPAPAPVNEVPADLDNDSFEGTFTGTELSFDDLTIKANGIPFPHIKMTTGTTTVNSIGGEVSMSLTGSALASGKMKVVLVVPLPETGALSTLSGGLVGAEIELEEQASP